MFLTRSVSLGVTLLLLACGGSSSTSNADAGADSGTIKPAQNHRAAASDCPADRPASPPASIPGTCAKDADCTQGKNGRCLSVGVNAPECSYDQCTKDSECGSAGVCQCRASKDLGANLCRQGNCRTDSDCGVVGKGFCSPSGVGIDASCREGIASGSFGYFCHTPSDTCTDDTDCGANGAACVFDASSSRWSCRTLSCTL